MYNKLKKTKIKVIMNREQANDLFRNGKTDEAIKAFQQILENINNSQENKD